MSFQDERDEHNLWLTAHQFLRLNEEDFVRLIVEGADIDAVYAMRRLRERFLDFKPPFPPVEAGMVAILEDDGEPA